MQTSGDNGVAVHIGPSLFNIPPPPLTPFPSWLSSLSPHITVMVDWALKTSVSATTCAETSGLNVSVDVCVFAASTGSGAYGSSNSVMGYGQAVSTATVDCRPSATLTRATRPCLGIPSLFFPFFFFSSFLFCFVNPSFSYRFPPPPPRPSTSTPPPRPSTPPPPSFFGGLLLVFCFVCFCFELTPQPTTLSTTLRYENVGTTVSYRAWGGGGGSVGPN